MFDQKLRSLTVAAASAVALLCASGASAATVTQLIHFDDASNPGGNPTVGGVYTTMDDNFSFDPANTQNSSLCADATSAATSNNGICLKEAGAGPNNSNSSLTTMTRNDLTPLDQIDNTLFSLDSFYMLFTGRGDDPNFFELSAVDALGNIVAGTTQKYQISTAAAPIAYSNVTIENTTTTPAFLTFGVGYFFDVSSFLIYDNVAGIRWVGSSSAQLRLDCVVATFDGTTTEPLSSFSNGCGTGDPGGFTPVPVPASLPLLAGGLGLAGWVLRRKQRKAA